MKLISRKEVLNQIDKLKNQQAGYEDSTDWVIGYLDALNLAKEKVKKTQIRAILIKDDKS